MLPNRLIKVLLGLSLVAVAGLYWQQQSQVFENKGRLSVRLLKDGQNTVVLSWHSAIEVPMVRRFEEAFAELGDKAGRFVIDLSSNGGALYEGRQMIELIDRMKRSHQVDTQVGEGERCLSMCVPIYLQGQNRLAAPDSMWMFHEPQYYDPITDERADGNERERKALAARFFEQYFDNPEINPSWRAGLRKAWSNGDVWRTGQKLVDENSGIVTDLM